MVKTEPTKQSLFVNKDFILRGLKFKKSLFNPNRIDYMYEDLNINGAKIFLNFGDMIDSTSLVQYLVGH